jgi:hypothetical protein
MLSWYLDLPHAATRTLFSSLSFLNRKNTRGAMMRRQMRFRGLWEPALALATYATRLVDGWLGTRSSVYGWGFYFGNVGEPVDLQPLPNVCIRCGQAHPAPALQKAGLVRRKLLLRRYQCPGCGASNVFVADG